MNIRKNWEEIQKYYDSGLSCDDIIKRFKISSATLWRAKKKGLFKPRTMSEGTSLYRKLNPDKLSHTEATKKKLSKIRTKHLKEHPDQVPYLLNHYSKGDSYPEKYFKELFEKENISLQFHKQIGLYQLDFYNEEKKIVIEIDGEQHYVDKRIVASDVKRTNFLVSLGWRIYRIRWSSYQRKSLEEKHKQIEEIRQLLMGSLG
jgi:very-short-patch-repair endonuclease